MATEIEMRSCSAICIAVLIISRAPARVRRLEGAMYTRISAYWIIVIAGLCPAPVIPLTPSLFTFHP
jgi:hypothetical protein